MVDGLIISHLISTVRDDFLILTNRVLYQAEELRRYLLPVDFSETDEALDINIKSRAAAKAQLMGGHCLIVFPAGGASTAPRPWSRRATDAEWKNLSAKLIAAAKRRSCPYISPAEQPAVPDREPHQHDAEAVAVLQGGL